MKKYKRSYRFFLIILSSIIFTSCTVVQFKTASPKQGEKLEIFPDELIGEYVNVKKLSDTLIISKKEYKIGRVKYAKNIIFEHGDLSDRSFLLKQIDGFYILNIRKHEDEGFWLALPIKLKENVLKVYYLNLELETKDKEKQAAYRKEKLKLLKSITEVKLTSKENSKGDTYLINPTDKELNRMLNTDLFDEILEFKKIVE